MIEVIGHVLLGSVLGGFVGGGVVAWGYWSSMRCYMDRVELMWNGDIMRINDTLEGLLVDMMEENARRMSTEPVGK